MRNKSGWALGALSLAIYTAIACGAGAGGDPAFLASFEAGQAKLQGGGEGAWKVAVAAGPDQGEVLTAKAGAGFTGTHALRYDATEAGPQRVELFRPKLAVAPGMHLSYAIFPTADATKDAEPANYVAVDLLFTDGSRLSGAAAVDQHRVPLSAAGQGAGRVLYPNQWNFVDVDLGKFAAGKTVKSIELAADAPAGSGAFHGYVDDIRLGPSLLPPAGLHPSDYVDTRRGTNANPNFSRGNNIPAITVPHGFNFWTPTTQADSDWVYQYQERNGPDNRPRLQALSLSHEPSPWMGDRQTFQIMPAAMASGAPPLDREARALSFSHDQEVARPYLYKVRFDNGIEAAMTPTDHAAMFQFTFAGDRSQLVFDNRNDQGGITLNPADQSLSGYTDVASRLSPGTRRMYFYARFDRPVSESGRLTGQGRDHVAAWYGFDTRANKTVSMRIATSLISLAQAKHNLELEIAAGDSFASVAARAQAQWDALLGKVEIPGAAPLDQVVLYSNLYRLFMYPNEAYENVGSAAQPDYRYASPFSPPTGPSSPTETGARVLAGKPYVNNGFWDTYRTAWPAYTLLTPTQAGEMIDGFVQQYRDGGWIARWSSPGYADLMVGTSADVAFADAWNKGVRNFDVTSFYQAALKDATVVSELKGTGRKGIERSVFHGYIDNATPEGLSWSMAGYLNDFGIAELAGSLAERHQANDPYAAHYADDARYFHERSRDFGKLYNAQAGFFISRKPDGQWRVDAAQFDPYAWGGDYTETDAWNMAFDAVHDGQGLANLYGGREGLARKLDAFFGAPRTFHTGDYGGVIHEMLEAHYVRMGQYGHSNQPAHHIIYMYDLAGQPWKTQDKVRDALSRLYVGSEIGQGYPGDEDNGEMSAWWVFSAAGFYPLRAGTPTYAIGAPYFPEMRIQLENGKRIEIRAPGVSDVNRYIQSVRLNGHPYTKAWLSHADLADGAVLEFSMGPKPSSWGTGADALLPSLTQGEQAPDPLHDLADDAGASTSVAGSEQAAKALSDNTSDTEAALAGKSPAVAVHFAQPRRVQMYTLTSAAAAGADPGEWALQGSADGKHWTTLDRRRGEHFPWRRQTRAFAVAHPGDYAYYRWQTHGEVKLAEIEWLGHSAGR